MASKTYRVGIVGLSGITTGAPGPAPWPLRNEINNSHTFMLEDGKHGGTLSPAILASKAANDPHSLLNPGKMRSLPG